MKAPNVRFWVYVSGGWCKITLRPGQSRVWWQTYRTEEGWGSDTERWEYIEGRIVRTVDSDGADCDGRLSTSATLVCPLTRLYAHRPPTPDAPASGVPDWDRLDARQRDYSAESMGY